MTDRFDIIAEQPDLVIMSHYKEPVRQAYAYQSEAELEAMLIERLVNNGYGHPTIKNEEELVDNLRKQLEKLNDYTFSDNEWRAFFTKEIANDRMTLEDKTASIQEDSTMKEITRDNGDLKNIMLIDKKHLGHNSLQVINQYVPSGGTAKNRYDVTILVNGLPMVHIELKRRGKNIKEAFNQIDRYSRESFWAGKALYEYVQLFVISNGTLTKYYSNSTRYSNDSNAHNAAGVKKTESTTFEFTSYWSDAENNNIYDLENFANTFLKKMTLLQVLTRYCVFTSDRTLMVMRPYQIAATERILQKIKYALLNRSSGKKMKGGYIWHTTGSGKTLTSFKTAQLASKMEGVKKVIFVVDRQDLDYQTMKEYDKFEKGCADGNADGQMLYQQLTDDNSTIIITTMQKMASVLRGRGIKTTGEKKYDLSKIVDQNIVFIFDECHRSQFGKMHAGISQTFKRHIMFGFTGTPIFAKNANRYGNGSIRTTAEVFGGLPDKNGNETQPLHKYTIIDAIKDKNVLKFNVDYNKISRNGKEQTEKDYMDARRIDLVAEYMLSHFAQKTKQSEAYNMSRLSNVDEIIANVKKRKKRYKAAEEKRQRVITKGFNSILAVQSVDMAIAYYKTLRRMIEEKEMELTIATIFTYEANEAEDGTGVIDVDTDSVDQLDATSKEFLNNVAMKDYNERFGTEYDASGKKFQNYYKDVSLRMKNKDIDILVVVGMFLTGFDAKTLNTLWVDKNLKLHGLLQAYSRTNRIFNSVKNCGNIICFRPLEDETNESFALFGDKDAASVVFMRTFSDYYYGHEEPGGRHHEGYKETVEKFLEAFPLKDMGAVAEKWHKKQFVNLFSRYLRLDNILISFDEYCPNDPEELSRVRILTEAQKQDYMSWYIDFYEETKGESGGGNDIPGTEGSGGDADDGEDAEFEIELVKQVEIDITYILMLVEEYRKAMCEDDGIRERITRSINASPDLRNKKDLIEQFVDNIHPDSGDIYDEWEAYMEDRRNKELDKIISEERLKEAPARRFIDDCLRAGYVEEGGTAISSLLPPMPLFGKGNMRAEAKRRVIEKLKAYFERFFNI